MLQKDVNHRKGVCSYIQEGDNLLDVIELAKIVEKDGFISSINRI